MKPEDLQALVARKTAAILDLERAKHTDPDAVQALAAEAARLEAEIAEAYLQSGHPEKAVANLISQASCLSDAKDIAGAIETFDKARSLAGTDKLKAWVQAEIEKVVKHPALPYAIIALRKKNRQLQEMLARAIFGTMQFGEPAVPLSDNSLRQMIATQMCNAALFDEVVKSASKPRPVHITTVALYPLLEQLVASHEMIAREHNLKLVCERGGTGVEAQGDSELLLLALSNLINHAIKYSAKGTQILMESVAKEDAITINISHWEEKMSVKNQALHFIPHFPGDAANQPRKQRQGLGLQYAKQMIETMGGTIGLKVAPEQSQTAHSLLTFALTLPRPDKK